jgi:gliding motility-associated-like protein
LPDATSGSNEITDTLYEGPSHDFYIRLENEEGCFDIAEITLSVQPSPLVNTQTQEFTVCNEGYGIGIFNLEDALSTAIGSQDDIMYSSIHLSYDDAIENIGQINTEDVELSAQTLHIRLENGTGCTSYGTFDINIENCPPEVPEAFSPNGDGANDIFTIHKLKSIYTNYKLSIFNRWGNLVYEGGDADPFWDGSVDGVIATDATGTVYFYVLELNDDVHEPLKGTIYVNP